MGTGVLIVCDREQYGIARVVLVLVRYGSAVFIHLFKFFIWIAGLVVQIPLCRCD